MKWYPLALFMIWIEWETDQESLCHCCERVSDASFPFDLTVDIASIVFAVVFAVWGIYGEKLLDVCSRCLRNAMNLWSGNYPSSDYVNITTDLILLFLMFEVCEKLLGVCLKYEKKLRICNRSLIIVITLRLE